MMATKWDVVLIEDNPARGTEFEAALKAVLKSRFNVVRLDTGDGKDKRAYEDRLLARLAKQQIALIVTDRDLSGMTHYPGLSEAPVSKVASTLFVPVCVYASGKPDSFLERQRTGGGGRIIVDPSDATLLAEKVKTLAEGFRQLRELVANIGRSKSTRRQYGGPASSLAKLLGAPEVVDHLALYTRGDQRMIAGLTPTKSGNTTAVRAEEVRRVSLMLGVWLYDSVLRYPGIVLDSTAAGSLLGVDPKSFRNDAVRDVFETALYAGPFADETEPRWWRHRLLELVEASKSDARNFVKAATGKLPSACKCSFDSKAPAGFVCMMTGLPVCEEHSVAEVGWLPRGADLARIRVDYFDQIGPFLGMS